MAVAEEPRIRVETYPQWTAGDLALYLMDFPGDGTTYSSDTIRIRVAVWGATPETPDYAMAAAAEASQPHTREDPREDETESVDEEKTPPSGAEASTEAEQAQAAPRETETQTEDTTPQNEPHGPDPEPAEEPGQAGNVGSGIGQPEAADVTVPDPVAYFLAMAGP